MRTINRRGLELVKEWEGIMDGDPHTVNLDPYLDPVGIWTIGWGHAIWKPDGKGFLRGRENESVARAAYPGGITYEQAETLLAADLMDAAVRVTRLVRVPINENQFSALVSFEFNLGKLSSSTLLHRLNVGNYTAAAAEFGKWVKGRDPKTNELVTLAGLVRRRAAERALFLLA